MKNLFYVGCVLLGTCLCLLAVIAVLAAAKLVFS